MAETLDPIDDGLWRWTARHPESHPSGFGDAVACFAVKSDAELLLIDPLLPADPGRSTSWWMPRRVRTESRC